MGALLLVLIAWLLPVGAAWMTWHTARESCLLLKHGIRTAGKVLSRQSQDSTIQYTADGKTYEITTMWWYTRSPVGGAVPVVYLADAPDRGRVRHWTDLWMRVLFWLGWAVFFGAVDILVLIRAPRN